MRQLFTLIALSALLISCSGGGGGGSSVGGGGGGGGGGSSGGVPTISTLAPALSPSNLVANNGQLIWSDGASPFSVHTIPTSGGSITPLALQLGMPQSIVVRGQDVFWAEQASGALHQTSAGETTTLAIGASCRATTSDIVVDDTDIYWVLSTCSPDIYTIQKVPRSGDPPTTITTTSTPIWALAGDTTNIYWEEAQWPDPNPISQIKKFPKNGGPTQIVASGFHALRGGLVVNGNTLVFSDSDFSASYRILKASISSGAVMTLATITTNDISNVLAAAVAADSTNVYWIDSTSLNFVPLNGGGVTTLANGLNSPVDLAVDIASAYWTEPSCCSVQTGSIKKVSLTGGTVTVLADQVDAPQTLTLDSSNVYWTEGGPYGAIEGFGRIAKTPIGGGVLTTVVTAVNSSASIAADSTNVYVVNAWTIKKVPINGDPVEKLVTGNFYIRDIATDGAFVYWIEDQPIPQVRKIAVTGGSTTTLASSSGKAGSIAVANGFVYWMDYFTIDKVPTNGGTPTVIIALGLPSLSDFVVDGTNVYFSDQDTGNIQKVSINGGPISTLVFGSNAFSPYILAQDDSNIYWVNQAEVGKVPKVGGNPTLYPENVQSVAFIQNSIAVDDTSVFWTEVGAGLIEKATPK